MAGVTFDDVTKVYEDKNEQIVAVEDLNLSIDDGEFLVLVGPSGCGKSTTLRMVAGLETITEGTISIGDTVVNGLEPRERDIAMVFQNYALYPHKTVQQNMAFGLKYSSDLSKQEINERVRETAEMMGIDDQLSEKPDQMSGGQRQRVALGRAIVRQPQVFLFDEPLSNLDAKLRTKMRTEISQLQNELEITSIYVTHDQAEAMTMGDIVAVMNAGKLQQAAPPNEVYNHPANEFVAGFIGSPSMNFLSATYQSDHGTARLVSTDERTEYPLAEQIDDQIDATHGDRIRIGVRPEDLQVVRDPEGWENAELFDATIKVVEPMGSDNYLTIDVNGADEVWDARVDSAYAPEVGTQVAVAFDESVVHLFDETGETLKSQGLSEASFHGEVDESVPVGKQ
ncbi:ABC transporter ATP-binding protein [Halobellus rarus]|uniref:ABC-type D-xylose/L-arabinose transporter n=1 Tax=Halobellus rarus TaxID=1126237 RepID=A0ABD6CQN1_9EURY|nr:sn-glycerol-3-phosphate ABC transporter ATP-binding protein UgpC [Halobellus rarus]